MDEIKIQGIGQLLKPLKEVNETRDEDFSIVQFVNQILQEAIQKAASDIHFEEYDTSYRIRYRLDGILSLVANPPIQFAKRIGARIKIMANMDISEKRLPQDGGFNINLSDTELVNFRVSTCPTVFGEKIVIRILNAKSLNLGIEQLGFDSYQQALFIKRLNRPQGMILVTGPTGCGKSMTLYTALNRLNTMSVNILTVEDPVEIKVYGINQVNINQKAGLSFANTLRSFLRQDPDIIMLGEIRDLETAQIAIKAAQTGHLVLSTLHTNSAIQTLTRLLDIGIPAFNLVGSISLIIAQRLARTLCKFCKVIEGDVYKAVGCKECLNGYKGRIGLFEVLPMTEVLQQATVRGESAKQLLKIAQKNGMLTIYESGLEKVRLGLTTLEEINRVTIEG